MKDNTPSRHFGMRQWLKSDKSLQHIFIAILALGCTNTATGQVPAYQKGDYFYAPAISPQQARQQPIQQRYRIQFRQQPQTAAPVSRIQLSPNAPFRYTVKRGDTLSGLASKYLRNPARWPELWRLNKEQVRNPHLIYPGQVLLLDRSGAQPRLRVQGGPTKLIPQVRRSALGDALPPLPPRVVEPFLMSSRIVSPDELAQNARIGAIKDERLMAGEGDVIYVINMGKKSTSAGSWDIVRLNEMLYDIGPDGKRGKLLGAEAQIVGSATMLQRGKTAVMRLVRTAEEISVNDFVVPSLSSVVPSYAPHAPSRNSRVLASYNDLRQAGQYSIVTIAGGANNGIEVGNIFAIYRPQKTVKNTFRGDSQQVTLPPERIGLLFVFRVSDLASYALVSQASEPVSRGYLLLAP